MIDAAAFGITLRNMAGVIKRPPPGDVARQFATLRRLGHREELMASLLQLITSRSSSTNLFVMFSAADIPFGDTLVSSPSFNDSGKHDIPPGVPRQLQELSSSFTHY